MGLALNILFAVACLALASTLPYFSPSNVFVETNTRLQTSTDVIFNRLAGRRTLTALDEILWSKLTSKEARLVYFTYGPHVLANCSFCAPNDPVSYLYYAIPSILAPHMLHLITVGIVTSSVLFGVESARWRTHATAVSVAFAVLELWLAASFDYRINTQSTNTRDIDFFFWRMRIIRSVGIAAIDCLLGLATWLFATNRMFQEPRSTEWRLDNVAKGLEALHMQLLAVGNVKNVIARDRELVGKSSRYWTGQTTGENHMYEEREVVDATREALSRIDRDLGQESVGERAQTQAELFVSFVRQLP